MEENIVSTGSDEISEQGSTQRLVKRRSRAWQHESAHGELRQLARRLMRRERLAHTLRPTALVHEAYLKLLAGRPPEWSDRLHFLRCAARAMRQVLVDHARKNNRAKRGGGFDRVELNSQIALCSDQQRETLLALNDALKELERLDARQAAIVELLYFTGVTQEEAAEVLNVSLRTVNREWRLARAWLRKRLATGRRE